MSRPEFQPSPAISRADVINWLMSSVAAEELALSHVLNTQGEALQYAVGTLDGLEVPADLTQIMNVNQSVGDLLMRVLENQVMLTGKMGHAGRVPVIPGETGPMGAVGPTGPDEGSPGPIGAIGPMGTIGPMGINGPIGPAGWPGDAGVAGAVGALGATGPTGVAAPLPPPTQTIAFATNQNGTSFPLLLLGTVVDVPLPSTQMMSSVTVNGANTEFTIQQEGYYRLSYHINLTLGILMGARLLVNGGAFSPTVIPGVLARSRFKGEALTYLSPGNTVKLQLVSGLVGSATLISGGTGASLLIERLS